MTNYAFFSAIEQVCIAKPSSKRPIFSELNFRPQEYPGCYFWKARSSFTDKNDHRQKWSLVSEVDSLQTKMIDHFCVRVLYYGSRRQQKARRHQLSKDFCSSQTVCRQSRETRGQPNVSSQTADWSTPDLADSEKLVHSLYAMNHTFTFKK